jgi:hypothetical protein
MGENAELGQIYRAQKFTSWRRNLATSYFKELFYQVVGGNFRLNMAIYTHLNAK